MTLPQPPQRLKMPDPAAPSGLTLDSLLDLMAERVAEKVAARLNSQDPEPTGRHTKPGQLLTVAEMATRLNITKREVYRQARTWPFTRKLSGRQLRFDEAGLLRWLERRR